MMLRAMARFFLADFVLLASVTFILASTERTAGILSGLNMPFLNDNPNAPNSKGNKFYIGFIGNIRQGNSFPTVALFVTTAEEDPVNVTIEYNSGGSRRVESQLTRRGAVTLFVLPANGDDDIQVDGNEQRNKGIYLKADGSKQVTVYGINSVAGLSADGFLALPYQTYDVQVYRYFVFSADIDQTFVYKSRFLLVGNEDDTQVTIIPTSDIDVPSDVSENGFSFTIDLDGLRNTGTLTLDRFQTVLFSSSDDLTGTIITSNKPLSVFVGHECAQIPTASNACEHLVEQIPPDTTWGIQFFTVPLGLRESGEHYRVGTVTNDNRVIVTCTMEGQVPQMIKNETINTKRGAGLIQWVEFDTMGVSRDFRRSFCCIKTSKPAVVMMYGKGHSVDKVTPPGFSDSLGDPFMSLVPPVSQYSNNYTITSATEVQSGLTYISYAIPVQFFNNTVADRSAFLINGTTHVPSSGYQPIYCSNGEICGYGAYTDLPAGNHLVEYNKLGATVNLLVYGFLGEYSFGYPAGFELEGIGVPRVSIFNVTVVENVSHVLVPINRTGGDLSRNTVLRASSRDGTAIAGEDYVARSNVRIRWQAGEVDHVPTDPPFKFEILDDEVAEAREKFFEIELTITRNALLYPFAVGRVTIIDDDGFFIGFEETSYTVDESAGTLDVYVRVISLPSDPINVNLVVQAVDESATREEDYRALSSEVPLTFNDTNLRLAVEMYILNDDLFESVEVFDLVLTFDHCDPRLMFGRLEPNVTSVYIKDDDNVTIGFFNTSFSLLESRGQPNIQVGVIDGSLQIELVIRYSITDLSRSNSSSDVFQVTLDSSMTRITLDLDFILDFILDVSRNARINITSNISFPESSRVTLDPQSALVEVDALVIGFSNEAYLVGEDENVTLTVRVRGGTTRCNNSVSEWQLVFNITALSAHSPEDYSYLTTTFNITNDSEAVSVTVPIVDDNFFEESETFTAVISLVNEKDEACIVLQPSKAEVTILDNDNATIGFVPNKYSFTELNDGGGGSVNLTVMLLMGELRRDLVVVIATTPGDLNPALPGLDFIIKETLTFSQDVTSVPVPIAIIDDDLFEPLFESFTVALSTDIPNLMLGNNATVTIEDDDTITIGLTSTSYTVDEKSMTALLTVSVQNGTFDGDSNITVYVRLFTLDGTASYNNGSEIRDYDAVTTVLGFNSSLLVQRVEITIYSDGILEVDEQFNVSLTLNTTAEEESRVILQPDTAVVTIIDNNVATIGFRSVNYSIIEGELFDVVTVEVLSGKLGREVQVILNTGRSGTAEVLLNSERPSTNITVNIDVLECKESIVLSLSFPGVPPPGVELDPSNAQFTIMDNNYTTAGEIGFYHQNIITTTECGCDLNVIFGLRSGIICDRVTVEFDTVNVDTTASDYVMRTISLVELTSDAPNHTITIRISDDAIAEPPESFVIELTQASASQDSQRIIFNPRNITVVIMDNDDANQSAVIIGGSLGAVAFIVIIAIIIVIALLIITARKTRRDKTINDESAIQQLGLTNFLVQSSYKLTVSPDLLIHSANITMAETVGQGEFGVVYRGHISSSSGLAFETVAIKTLKGFYDRAAIRDMLKECSKMSMFNHPNVLTLRGVCLDGGPSPFIIMPFMNNGSLLSYLKKNRATLVVSEESTNKEEVGTISKQLMDMCRQVAMGMEYLAKMKLVHRDLAARNCMMDINHVIKVADFGLSESVGTKEYFRQDKLAIVRLPLKWLAPESLEDYIFSEKSDVWAYGVTCWEIFTAGKVPYTTINLTTLLSTIRNGYRLEKPTNSACSDEMYELMLNCWQLEPNSRPTFSNLVDLLSQKLETTADYMDIGDVDGHSQPVEYSRPGSVPVNENLSNEIQDQSQPPTDETVCEETVM